MCLLDNRSYIKKGDNLIYQSMYLVNDDGLLTKLIMHLRLSV